MKDPENIIKVTALHPDMMGFIFVKESPRYIGENYQEKIALAKGIPKVGVFRNASLDEILSMESGLLDFVQLHGSESVEYCKALKNNSIKVIKSFNDLELLTQDSIEEYEQVVEMLLIDGAEPGSGIPFDWQRLKGFKFLKKLLVAGGVSLDNYQDLIEIISKHPISDQMIGLDVNSKIEILPGLKDLQKVEKFIEIRNASNV